MKRALALVVLALALAAPAQEPAEDTLVREALQAFHLGNTEYLEQLADDRRDAERAARRTGDKPAPLAAAVAVLAATTRDTLPTTREARRATHGMRTGTETRALLLLLQRHEPRDQFAEAAADRRYEERRRVVNSVTGALGGLLSLQIFPLVQVPLDGLEYLFSGRRYLNPEQRRELQAARAVAGDDSLPEHDRARATRRAEALHERRLATAALHARRNAEKAFAEQRPETAAWWFDRELLFLGATEPVRRHHRDALFQVADDARRRYAANLVRIEEPPDDATLAVVRALVIDPASPETDRAIRTALAERGATDDLRAAEAAWAHASGRRALALVMLHDMGTRWSARAAAYAARADFDPPVAFDDARRSEARRARRYLWQGEDPRANERTLTGEQARLVEAQWIARARALFVIDILGRALTRPLAPSTAFPRDERFAAVAISPADYLTTEDGRRELRAAARYARRHARYDDARRWATLAGDFAAAERARRAAAQDDLRTARALAPADPRRLPGLEQITADYPGTPAARRAAGTLERDAWAMGAAVVLTAHEVRRDGPLRDLLQLDDPGPGPVGVWADGAVRQPTREIARLDDVQLAALARHLARRNRAAGLREARDAPRSRKRIPIEIEGGAFPGFDIMPGLVPLEPNERQRRLYE